MTLDRDELKKLLKKTAGQAEGFPMARDTRYLAHHMDEIKGRSESTFFELQSSSK